jgi:hypothetical protein
MSLLSDVYDLIGRKKRTSYVRCGFLKWEKHTCASNQEKQEAFLKVLRDIHYGIITSSDFINTG